MPLAVVQARSDENALPFIEQRRMKIQSTVDEFQDVTVWTDRAIERSSKSEDSIRQSRSEAKLNVVAFLTTRLDRDQASLDDAHRADSLARLSIKSVLARTVELVINLIFQVRNAEAIVLAG